MTSLLPNHFIKIANLVETRDRISQVYQYTKGDDEIFIRFVNNRFGINYNREKRPHQDPPGMYAYNVVYEQKWHEGSHFGYNRDLGFVFKYPWRQLEESNKCLVLYDNSYATTVESDPDLWSLLQKLCLNIKDITEGEINILKNAKRNDWFHVLTNKLYVESTYITKAFMALGIDSIYDSGVGIINRAEPCQLLCFTEKYIQKIDLLTHNTEADDSFTKLINRLSYAKSPRDVDAALYILVSKFNDKMLDETEFDEFVLYRQLLAMYTHKFKVAPPKLLIAMIERYIDDNRGNGVYADQAEFLLDKLKIAMNPAN